MCNPYFYSFEWQVTFAVHNGNEFRSAKLLTFTQKDTLLMYGALLHFRTILWMWNEVVNSGSFPVPSSREVAIRLCCILCGAYEMLRWTLCRLYLCTMFWGSLVSDMLPTYSRVTEMIDTKIVSRYLRGILRHLMALFGDERLGEEFC